MNLAPLQGSNLESVLAELRRITAMVSLRVEQLRAINPAIEEDEFRGLYVSEEEINQLLSDPNLFLVDNGELASRPNRLTFPNQNSRLSYLQKAFNLSAFELDVLLIALAPEVDLRYEKLFSFLQDDVTRRRPTVDLALRLLCPGLAGQVAARRCFDSEAPLLKYRLLELSEENQQKQVSLLARSIKLDEGLVAYLLGESRLDARLRLIAEFAFEGGDNRGQKSAPTETGWLDNRGQKFAPTVTGMLSAQAEEYLERLVELIEVPQAEGYVCVLSGADEDSKRTLAVEVCQRLGLPLVTVNAALLPGLPKLESTLRLLEREARLRGAALYWQNYETLLKEEAPAQEALRLVSNLLKEPNSLQFVSANVPLAPLSLGHERVQFQIHLDILSYGERQQFWESQLGAAAIGLDLEGLSSRFRLSSGQVVAATATARAIAAWRGETTPTMDDLEAACRRHSNQRLSNLARKIIPNYKWSDIVLPTDQYNMLREICEQVRHRSLVYEKWGFDKKISLGKGLNMIFAGPSGTGKTMSAEIIAGELRMDLYKIDLSNMVSKYIGETEKNLDRIFTEAGESNAILFFDEADSIFGKRSEVKDAHDRYANIETGYLLQKMEEYEGIVVLATNLRKNLDDAFVRRMHFMLEYPFPDEEDRLKIWQRAFPKQVPMSESVDLRFMARQFKITGGNIKNIALASAFLAASEAFNPSVEMVHVIKATRREFQKMGKLCTESDFGPYFSWLKN